MSFEITDEYLNKGLKGAELLVYAFLRKYIEQNGAAPSSYQEVADELNISERQVWRSMSALKKDGHVIEIKSYKFS